MQATAALTTFRRFNSAQTEALHSPEDQYYFTGGFRTNLTPNRVLRRKYGLFNPSAKPWLAVIFMGGPNVSVEYRLCENSATVT